MIRVKIQTHQRKQVKENVHSVKNQGAKTQQSTERRKNNNKWITQKWKTGIANSRSRRTTQQIVNNTAAN
jgi:hypothetical protein